VRYIDSCARSTTDGSKVIPFWKGIGSYARSQGWEGAPPPRSPRKKPRRTQEENEKMGMKKPPPGPGNNIQGEAGGGDAGGTIATSDTAVGVPPASDTTNTTTTKMEENGAITNAEKSDEEESAADDIPPGHKCTFQRCHSRVYLESCLTGKSSRCHQCGRKFMDTAVNPRPKDGKNTATEFWPSINKPVANCPRCGISYCFECHLEVQIAMSPRTRTKRRG
jgi:hypothetical protein